jgi:BMFP domain-containing protein YqiC
MKLIGEANMESSQTLNIMLDMLRSNLANALHSVDHVLPIDREQLDNTLKTTLDSVREDLLEKFELVAKADYEAQTALVENMRAQLDDLESRLRGLEQQQSE